ncbi:MAG: hypothetical protein WBV78_12935 [Roseobacter sp.]
MRSNIDFRAGAYTPRGFPDDEPERWHLIEEAAEFAGFIGVWRERDDQMVYADHIGVEACCRRLIALAFKLGKRVHIRATQKNHDREDHTERLTHLIRAEGFVHEEDKRLIWLVHVISRSVLCLSADGAISGRVEHRCDLLPVSSNQHAPVAPS